MRVLTATAFDGCGDIFWRVDEEYAPITIFVNCNDLFFWGCADAEQITTENLEVLEQSYKDDERNGGLLFCCRVRGERPQGAYYKHIKKEKRHLYDACGPEKETGFGNPISQHDFD
jgi:hypothetical protein